MRVESDKNCLEKYSRFLRRSRPLKITHVSVLQNTFWRFVGRSSRARVNTALTLRGVCVAVDVTLCRLRTIDASHVTFLTFGERHVSRFYLRLDSRALFLSTTLFRPSVPHCCFVVC